MNQHGVKNNKKNKLWSYVINIILTFLLLFLLTSIVFTIKDSLPVNFLFTIVGLKNLIVLYDTSIKIGAAFVAFLTLKVYFSRMNQTEIIIERTNLQVTSYIKSENLKNYFLHRKEFRNYFQELKLFKNSSDDKSISFYSIWDSLYRAFYYSSYRNFEPKLNQYSKTSITSFLNNIKKSPLDSLAVPAFDVANLNEIVTGILPAILETVNTIAEIKNIELIKNNKIKKEITFQELNTISLLLKIKVTKQLYESILSFDGENIIPLSACDNNISEYFKLFKSKYYED